MPSSKHKVRSNKQYGSLEEVSEDREDGDDVVPENSEFSHEYDQD